MGNISIVIVTWNNEDEIIPCIESIRKYSDISDIVIVDSKSSDNTVEIIKNKNYNFVKLIECDENVGFSKGNNIGVREIKNNKILFLNPDTLFIENGIENLVNVNNDVGIIGCKLLNKDLTLQVSTYNFDTPINIILEQFMIGKIFPEFLKYKYSPYLSKHNKVFYPDWVIGAFMLMDKKLFEEIGGFSEEYFLYSEDMDICKKVNMIGLRIQYNPNFKIIHLAGQSEKKDINSRKQEKLLDSKFIYANKFNVSNIGILNKCYILKFKLYKMLNNNKENKYKFPKEYIKKKINFMDKE